jgi:hypothetical protein
MHLRSSRTFGKEKSLVEVLVLVEMFVAKLFSDAPSSQLANIPIAQIDSHAGRPILNERKRC